MSNFQYLSELDHFPLLFLESFSRYWDNNKRISQKRFLILQRIKLLWSTSHSLWWLFHERIFSKHLIVSIWLTQGSWSCPLTQITKSIERSTDTFFLKLLSHPWLTSILSALTQNINSLFRKLTSLLFWILRTSYLLALVVNRFSLPQRLVINLKPEFYWRTKYQVQS